MISNSQRQGKTKLPKTQQELAVNNLDVTIATQKSTTQRLLNESVMVFLRNATPDQWATMLTKAIVNAEIETSELGIDIINDIISNLNRHVDGANNG